MNSIQERLVELRREIDALCEGCGRSPDEVEILAVSKTRSVEQVEAAVAAGQMAYGENRVGELVGKANELVGRDLSWHMIGSVQTNKLRDLCAVPGLKLLHSLDRVRLVDALQKQCEQQDLVLGCLLQINATGEEGKHGVRPAEVEVLAAHVVADCPRIDLQGVMAMGPLVGDPQPVFAEVTRILKGLRDRLGLPLATVSMGMTGDLPAAITAGSTLVRVGTGVFGPRSDG